MSPLDRGGACCLPCKPWADHANTVNKPCRTTVALKRIGYTNLSSIRKLARQIYLEESPTTRNLGFCPRFVPEKGPEQDKHWRRLIEMISLCQGLGWRNQWEMKVDLDVDTIEPIMEIISSLGVKHLPKSNRQKELLANIIGGAFGQDVKDAMIAHILQWNTPPAFFGYEGALSRSFGWLKEIVNGFDNNRVWFTEFGIVVIGTSGNVYEIAPSPIRPRYRVTLPDQDTSLCLNTTSNDEPFGDVLVALVLALYNDEISAQQIPLLEAVLPKPSPETVVLSDTQCASCTREMIDGDYTSNPNLAPRSTVNPALCKTCNAGCDLPEGVEQPEDD